MLRTLLAERFKLTFHNERRELPIYALVIARRDGKLGSQLHPSSDDCAATVTSGTSAVFGDPNAPLKCGAGFARPGHTAARALGFSAMVTTVSNVADRLVMDRTKLSGNFDWDLQW